MKKGFIITILLLSVLGNINSQTIKEKIEFAGSVGEGEYSPMWHLVNRQGIGSINKCMSYMRNDVAGFHNFSKSGISLNWNLSLVAGINLTNYVFIQQAYIDLDWKMFRLSVGQKERWSEYGDRNMTTGALVESGNARPIPQVRIEMPEYWNVPGCKGWFGLKGHLAYGMFTDGAWQKRFFCDSSVYAKNVLYHSKELQLRFGNKEKFPLTAEIGLLMTTQFGGDCYNSRNELGNNHKNPTRFKDFLLALIPLKGDNEYDGSDQTNVAGNVLGSWLGAITWNSKIWKMQIYYDHTFNDHSQMFWEYGLWTEQLVGIELELKKLKWINKLTFEYFNLKDQSGPIYHDSTNKIPDQISCKDNNYNHSRFAGWFNYGMMIGTPLCTAPIYNKDRLQICYNNRVEAFHIGIAGSPTKWLDYRILLTHSNNWGTYTFPFEYVMQNTSGLVETTLKPDFLNKWCVTFSFAFDNGELYGNNYGGLLTVRRDFVFDLKR